MGLMKNEVMENKLNENWQGALLWFGYVEKMEEELIKITRST